MAGFDEVRVLLKRKCELFAQMLSLAEEQLELAKRGEKEPEGDWLDRLLSVIERRQRLMEEIDAVSSQLSSGEPGEAAGTGTAEGLSDKERLEYRALLGQMRHIVETIQEKDLASQEVMETRVKELEGRLAEVRASRRANQAYLQSPGATPPWFVDKKR